MRRERLARFAGVGEPSKKRIEPINRGVSVVLKQAAVPRKCERNTVVPGPLGDLANVAACGHHDRDKAVPKSMESDAVQPGAQHGRPQNPCGPTHGKAGHLKAR